MDVNATLAEIRELRQTIQADFENGKVSEYDANRLAELVEALDGWLTGGGFLPAAWERKRTA